VKSKLFYFNFKIKVKTNFTRLNFHLIK